MSCYCARELGRLPEKEAVKYKGFLVKYKHEHNSFKRAANTLGKISFMAVDELLKMTRDLEAFCEQNNIFIFEGEAACINSVIWKGKGEKDFLGLLQLVPSIGLRFITVEKEKNMASEDLLDKIDPGQLEHLELQQDYDRIMSLLKQVHGHISCVRIHFSYGNVLYTFQREAPWKADLDDIIEEFSSDDEEDEEDSSLEDENGHIPAPYTQHDVEEKARRILEEKIYQDAPDPFKRHKIFTQLWDKLEGWDNRMLSDAARMRAEELYQEEIFPAKEAEIGAKVRLCKQQGLTQIATRHKLGITPGQLKRHWYRDPPDGEKDI